MASIWKAAVGDQIMEFDEAASIDDVWKFVDQHMSVALGEKALAFVDASGDTLGCLWDSSIYYAHMETPNNMLAYFRLHGFGSGDDE